MSSELIPPAEGAETQRRSKGWGKSEIDLQNQTLPCGVDARERLNWMIACL
ncbi:MAG: hypothetical protein XE04_1831 [Marinimicrobia bacterium 46_43]|nr:MAG: hypothetical protein XE04_1831 [Marinimicrobia bacterium 46_43]